MLVEASGDSTTEEVGCHRCHPATALNRPHVDERLIQEGQADKWNLTHFTGRYQ